MANPENKQIPYESTQQDIRDAIESVATAIGGIAVPSADHVSYDNSGSGLSATDVQNALDEIVSDIPTVNNGTLTIQQNGTSKGSFTANSASNVNVNIETPTADKKTATDQFTTADGGLLSKCQINLVPVQSGSGDPSPDNVRPISGHTEVGLAVNGKNWCTRDTSANIYNAGHLIPVKNGDTVYCYFEFSSTQNGKMYGAFTTNKEETNKNNTTNLGDFTSGTVKSYTMTADGYFCVCYGLGVATYTVDKAMISTSPITDFEPYLGHLYQVQIGSTVYGGYVDLVSGVMICDRGIITYNGSEGWTDHSSGRFYLNGLPTNFSLDKRTQNEWFTCNSRLYIAGAQNYGAFATYGTAGLYCTRLNSAETLSDFTTSLSSENLVIIYPLANPITINLTPQQIETLAGQNNLSTPLDGQSIETNGVEYKELFTFADVKEYVKPLIPYSNAGSHNAIYRGKYLGDHVTPEQWASIVAGTFDDLFIGDYWTINSVNWRIAHFDYWLGTGDTECTTHHVVIVPDTALYNAKMNSSNITTGGYYNSEMRGGSNYLVSGSSNLYSASETIKSAFGSSHILTHRELLTNDVTSGSASNWDYYDSSVELMSEVMIYGCSVWSMGGGGYEIASSNEQLALFRHDITKVTNRANYWLRNVHNASDFCDSNRYGRPFFWGANNATGVRPCFAIK